MHTWHGAVWGLAKGLLTWGWNQISAQAANWQYMYVGYGNGFESFMYVAS